MPKVIKAPFFSMRIAEDKEGKLSFSISKKVDKRATRRNKLRRQFKASLNNLIKKGSRQSLRFSIKKEALGKSQQEIEAQLGNALQKEGLLK